jgi:hypothetical protein
MCILLTPLPYSLPYSLSSIHPSRTSIIMIILPAILPAILARLKGDNNARRDTAFGHDAATHKKYYLLKDPTAEMEQYNADMVKV